MFVMGNACPTCNEACEDVLLPADGDEKLQLDLMRYQRINMQPMTNSDVLIHNSAINAATYELKVGLMQHVQTVLPTLYCMILFCV